MRRGRLIGVGVGPGDPELVTVKAARAIERAAVVASVAAAGRGGRAREIASAYVRPGTRELVAALPMTADAEATGRAYARLATGIAGELEGGTDVAFLCEGDPLLYGSFAHLLERLGPLFPCEAIPGVSSLSAAAAATLQPLALRDQPLAVLPATLPQGRLEAALRAADRAAVLKLGRRLPVARAALAAAGMLRGAVLVENATTRAERLRPLEAVPDGEAVPYFSLILAGRP